MAIVSPTTTTIGGVTTTTAAKDPSFSERIALFSPEQKKAWSEYLNTSGYQKERQAIGGTRAKASDYNNLVNKYIDSFLGQNKPTDTLSTLLPDDMTTSLLSSGEDKDILAQKDDVAAMEQYLNDNDVGGEVPTAESTLPEGETKAELTTEPKEEKKNENLGNVNVPTQNYVLGNTPNNNLPSNVDAAPKVPTKANVSINAKARRGRASTIGLGRRSANTELSSNIVKLLGV